MPAGVDLLVWSTTMTLIKCKECGGQLSSDAKFCPHYGYDTPPAAKEAVIAIGCMGIVAQFLLLILIAALTAKQ